eukprot:Seg3537.1 transcript_id=Seg3537.1/GoldUCD/mRNA.D3Y31 product="hypothetical protein" protein_id=Seg3537.1/GoldUCD/D3Y31
MRCEGRQGSRSSSQDGRCVGPPGTIPAHTVRSESLQPASMAPQRCVGPPRTMPAHTVRSESLQPALMAPQRCVVPPGTMPAHMVRSESCQSAPMASQRCEGPPSSRISHMVYTQTAQPRMVPPRYHEDPIIGMSSQLQSWPAPSPQQSWQPPSPQQSWQFQSRAPEQLPGYLSMEPITLDSPQPRSHAHENWRENIQHATPLRAGEEARRAGEVSLNEAEEDRKIAKKLLENVLDGIDWENGSRDYWQDKKHAAIRAHKRLELKNEELEGKGWDDELTEAECKQFQAWMKDLQELKYLSFPRLVRQADNKPDETVLHAFCDASSIGYCATVYLVTETAYRIESTLLTAKCRLAPLKKLTIPRLELLAGRTGAKLVQTVIANLTAWKISTVYIWLDSLTALYWIANKGAWKPYVNNRVKEIHQLVPGANWRHCPTQENPADLGTRGASAVKLQHNKLWWEGPQFITEGKESWPSQPKEFQPSEHVMIEERSPSLVVKADEIGSLNVIIDAKRFSRLSKLLVCTARVLRFVNNCRSRVRCVDAMVTPEEMKDAKDRWIKTVQSEMAKREDFQAKTRDLGAYVHSDGYIRCAGRLRNAGLALDQTHPILLPSKHRFTDLVIMESHQNIGHEKVGRTLAEVRSAFWIPRGRQVIKSLLRSCAICKVFASKHIRAPEMAPLPEIRAVRSRPFQHTGVDFAGPLHVKSGQEMVKSYIALFTCATTRAVHLELTPDLTAPIFRMTLEKFAAAWGMPNLLVSDNATTFKTTAIQLKALVEHPEVQEYLQSHFLTWRFNLALASWWGGWFEKMVGLTKTILKKTLGKASLSYFEMEVVLKKTQGILNNRPLFYQGEELEEEVLTPNHLIFGHRLPQMPDVPDDIFEDYKDMTLRLKHVEAKLNELWSRWSREYLVGLREFHKAKVSSKGTAYQLKPGDIILIENKSAHKGMWKKGRILHMVTGKDGVARGASIATIVNGKVHRLERALQQIYPLEIRVEDDIPVKPENLGQSMRRSTRAAAITAKQKISTLVEEVNQQDND